MVAMFYAPSDSPNAQAYLWHKLEISYGQWVILGDFNMIEISANSSRPSPLIKGRQLKAWGLLTTHLDLKDAYYLPQKLLGMRFTI